MPTTGHPHDPTPDRSEHTMPTHHHDHDHDDRGESTNVVPIRSTNPIPGNQPDPGSTPNRAPDHVPDAGIGWAGTAGSSRPNPSHHGRVERFPDRWGTRPDPDHPGHDPADQHDPADRAVPRDTDRDSARDTGSESSGGADRGAVLVDRPYSDPAGARLPLPDRLRQAAENRQPVVPTWLRNPRDARDTARFAARHAAHTTAWHVTRAPKYAGKIAARAPRGAARVCTATTRWALDAEAHPIRQEAVRRLDTGEYRLLRRERNDAVKKRTGIVLAALLGLTVLTLVVVSSGSWWLELGAAAVVVGVLGWLGQTDDSPIFTRAVVRSGVEPLTSDVVVRALGALGLAGINQALSKGSGVAFAAPITRDGPGFRADVDLPYGVTAADVAERRDKLASGLRRPLGCVWPEGAREVHEGRLVLWVGDKDMSKCAQPPWELDKRTTAVDLFKAQAFGTDQRGRWVNITLMYIAMVIGAIPRMGKTVTVRELLLLAAFDPRAELHTYDLKGTGDFSPLEQVSHAYGVGDDPQDIEAMLADMRGLREELRRRAKVIRELPRDVCPDNKVTTDLAGKKSLRLHPVVVAVDECQVWFEHPDHGKEFEEICTDLVKRGPALGFVSIFATQRPDAKSLPTGISANASTRYCLKVTGQGPNDQVLGTSQYKQGIRATTFAWSDKGIGYLIGEGTDAQIVRCVYRDGPASEKIAARARALREHAGRITGHAAGDVPTTETDAGSGVVLIEDVAAVIAADEDKVWSERIVDRLAELRPDHYATWAGQAPREKATTLAGALKPYRVATGQVHGTTDDGRPANRRGITRSDVLAALHTHRETHPRTNPGSNTE